ncbi:beta-conglycinin, beta chain-like [Abrus precatorius]|uniref:Beta-conglycinin, beta chain-like n=1 Tax=Abrus precatorius TaxID=3816 RepID=A0A8B8MI98_ABRPR|nr:beta-conglycinin, beta chain-like [Abrus precatorius]
MMKARFPLLLLLGILFLASVSVSFGIAHLEKESPSYKRCLQSCKREQDVFKQQACLAHCQIFEDPQSKKAQEEKEPPSHEEKEHAESHRQSGHQEGEKEEKEHQEQDQPSPRPRPQPRQPHPPQESEHKQRQPHPPHESEHKHQEEGQDQPQPRQPHPHQESEHKHEEHQHQQEEQDQPFPRPQEHEHKEQSKHHNKEQESEKEQGPESEPQKPKNPFHFNNNKFHTLVNNKFGYIRVLQRFEQRSNKLQNLREFRIVQYKFKPNVLLLPHHADADFLLVVLDGSALITLLSPDERESYKLQRGDALRIPAGTPFYLLNPDDNQNLKVVKLAVPANQPGKVQDFFPFSSEDQESFLRGFSENTLEASFDAPFEEIEKTLLEEEEQEVGVLVEVSKEQIQELSKDAKSSSRKSISSENEPFNLRSRGPIYSNKFGKFFEIPPHKNPQLQELDIFLDCVEIKEGGLLLPHYNSKAIVVLVVNKGKAKLELVGLKEQHQKQEQQQEEEEEQEGPRKVQSYRAKLSEGDIFVIPASYPVAINASTDFHLVAFGINAENNQRNFLAGEKDNVISQIHKLVKNLAFPGSGEQVEKLLKKQSESYFADAQPQQSEEDNKGRKGRLSSILNAFH